MSEFSDSDVRNAVAFIPEETAVMELSEREGAKFDRWLADHDRRIKAEAAATALEDAANAADSQGHHWSGPTAGAMFVLAEEFRTRAAEIREVQP